MVFALAGPFGSYQALDLGHRFLVWSVVVAIGVVSALFFRAVLRDLGGWHRKRRTTFVVALICTLLFTWPLYLYAKTVFTPASSIALPEVALFVFVCSLRLSRMDHIAALHQQPAPTGPAPLLQVQPDPASDPPPLPRPTLPRIVQRLDPEVQGRLAAISVRNHHVEVTTTAGQGQLLLRLADAMEETEGEEGAQIHRSHWVAWWAISGVEREGARLWLTLSDGAKLPVSRTHREKLEERGLV
ncbi:MAG: LytTR family DNA-binding domain-containing protein [Gemmobacter sp.]